MPTQCNLQDSMRILTYGIPNLRVSIEDRRQVFVEHSNDVLYFESLFDIVSRVNEFQTIPQFLPPHTQNGSNCSAVIEITRKLRDMGNSQVYGLIDWDLNNSVEPQIIVLGMSNRYSVENYIFEPHFIGLYLIHKNYVKPSDLGLEGCNSYLDVINCVTKDKTELQKLVDSVEDKISWEGEESQKVESKLIDGTIIQIRKEVLTIKGHKLEDLCREAWPQLNRVKNKNSGDSLLKMDVIDSVINDFPSFISTDIVNTFNEFK